MVVVVLGTFTAYFEVLSAVAGWTEFRRSLVLNEDILITERHLHEDGIFS